MKKRGQMQTAMFSFWCKQMDLSGEIIPQNGCTTFCDCYFDFVFFLGFCFGFVYKFALSVQIVHHFNVKMWLNPGLCIDAGQWWQWRHCLFTRFRFQSKQNHKLVWTGSIFVERNEKKTYRMYNRIRLNTRAKIVAILIKIYPLIVDAIFMLLFLFRIFAAIAALHFIVLNCKHSNHPENHFRVYMRAKSI